MNKIYTVHCWDGTKDDGVENLDEIYNSVLSMLKNN